MANLYRIFITVQGAQANLANLTSDQFDEWVATKAVLPGGRWGLPWSLQQREEWVDWYRETGGVLPEKTPA